MSNFFKYLGEKKVFIYFVRVFAWVSLLIIFYIALFHSEIYVAYRNLFVLYTGFMVYAAGYKINLREMSFLEKVISIGLRMILFNVCLFVVYKIGCLR